jgi:hypothetical protein
MNSRVASECLLNLEELILRDQNPLGPAEFGTLHMYMMAVMQ